MQDALDAFEDGPQVAPEKFTAVGDAVLVHVLCHRAAAEPSRVPLKRKWSKPGFCANGQVTPCPRSIPDEKEALEAVGLSE